MNATLLFALGCGLLAITVSDLYFTDHSTPHVDPPSLTSAEHEYLRPSDDQVWGLPGSTSLEYLRSPCPALNALANHGHLPRDGKNVTLDALGSAIVEVYNIDRRVLHLIFLALPMTFTLADLGDPDFIEHDASLVHADSFFNEQPFKVNETLVTELVDVQQHVVTPRALAQFRRSRELDSLQRNPEYSMSALASFVANGEAAFLLLGLGDRATSTITVEHARSFLLDERIPDDFRRPDTPVTVSMMLFTIAKLKLLAWLD